MPDTQQRMEPALPSRPGRDGDIAESGFEPVLAGSVGALVLRLRGCNPSTSDGEAAAREAIGKLRKLGPSAEPALPELAALLRLGYPVGTDAAQAMVAVGRPGAEALLDVLRDEPRTEHRVAWEALASAELRPSDLPRMWAPLSGSSSVSSYFSAVAAASVRAASEPSSAAPGASESRAAEPDSPGRLSPTAVAEVSAFLLTTLTDANRNLRQCAAEALGELSRRAVADAPAELSARWAMALGTALRDPDVSVRETAGAAMQSVGPANVVALAALTAAIDDESEHVRARAAEVLAELGTAAASAAAVLARRLRGLPPPKKRARDWEATGLARALGQMGPTAAAVGVPALLDRPADRLEGQLATGTALYRLGHLRTLPPILADILSAGGDFELVSDAMEIARSLGSAAAPLAPLIEQLGRDNPWMIAFADSVLRDIRASDAEPK